MPYMKTDDGAIPSIITDHIGVYLGSIKGRGNIVEVREGSLVKAFIPAAGDSKPNGVHTSIVKSTDNPNSTAADEEAKAAEEFKKTMYGTADDGSSSDEEGVSKTKKLQIRIRDKSTSGTVDVNKIKEATKRLGDDLVLLRILARVNSTLILLAVFLPLPLEISLALIHGYNLHLDHNQLQPPATKGVGIAAGPIPEDFFQNTIPSLQVAASLPPAGTYLSKLDQTSQQVEVGSKVPPDQINAPAAGIGFPDDGVPPQATEQPSPPESIGLPDDGVPPQYSATAGGMPSQVQPAQMQLSAQPLDLSALGVPNSAESGKPTPSASAPAPVCPGQVPHGAAASICFKIGLAHLEQNQLPDALSCFDEAFLALAKDNSRGVDIKAQATICAQYKIAVTLLQEIMRLQKVQGPRALSAKDEMARLSRHLGKQEELRSLIDICVLRGSTNKSIDPLEDPSQFCGATLGRLSTIGYDVCDLCGAKFSALSTPGCIICGVGSIKRSDALPFG
ncbi:hypothetical protein DITRI_Ditri18aG0094000 [Diplodiscus trichospermus]